MPPMMPLMMHPTDAPGASRTTGQTAGGTAGGDIYAVSSFSERLRNIDGIQHDAHRTHDAPRFA